MNGFNILQNRKILPELKEKELKVTINGYHIELDGKHIITTGSNWFSAEHNAVIDALGDLELAIGNVINMHGNLEK